jgi:hypothetical protein
MCALPLLAVEVHHLQDQMGLQIAQEGRENSNWVSLLWRWSDLIFDLVALPNMRPRPLGHSISPTNMLRDHIFVSRCIVYGQMYHESLLPLFYHAEFSKRQKL